MAAQNKLVEPSRLYTVGNSSRVLSMEEMERGLVAVREGSNGIETENEVVINASRELTPCNTFMTNDARVDSACRNILIGIARQLQAEPQASLVIVGYRDEREKPVGLSLQRANNVRDRFTDGSLGVQIDAKRITVRDCGISTDGSHVRMWLVPSGAAMPRTCGTATDGGPITPKKPPANRPWKAKAKKK